MAESRTRSSDGRKRAKREAEEEKPPARPDLKVIEIHVFRGPNSKIMRVVRLSLVCL